MKNLFQCIALLFIAGCSTNHPLIQTSAGSTANVPVIGVEVKSQGHMARERFAESVQNEQNFIQKASAQGPGAMRLTLVSEKGPGAAPRAPTPLEMQAKKLGFRDIVYSTPDGEVTVKINP